MKNRSYHWLLGLAALFFTGCATTIRTSPTYPEAIKKIKTIAVMPADVRVYQLSAGGVREEIDEWSIDARSMIREALKTHLGDRHDFQVKYIEEEWLKSRFPELWRQNRALYNAVSFSVALHAYPSPSKFPDKVKRFDYTLGDEIQPLAQACGADSLLFIYGYDHEATAGRVALWWWNFALGMVSGVTVLPTNPSGLTLGLVNGETGNLEWFNGSPGEVEYSFRSQKHINDLIEWLTRHFVKDSDK